MATPSQRQTDALVHGHAERGVPSDGPHKPRTGAGYVKRKDGDYARAKGNGCESLAALIESFSEGTRFANRLH